MGKKVCVNDCDRMENDQWQKYLCSRIRRCDARLRKRNK